MDLSMNYCGLALKNPIVAAASPLSKDLDSIKRLAESGVGAIVMYSLFEEQINYDARELDHYLNYGTDSYGEATSYFPDLETYNVGPEAYLELIRQARAAVDVPIIGSLNGSSPGGWTGYARKIAEAGASAIELNIYHIPASTEVTSAEVEEVYEQVVRDVKRAVNIPVAVKLGPFFSSFANLAHRLVFHAGADALVLFNRFYQPDFDLEALEVVPRVSLSTSQELLLRLRWAAMLYGRLQADLAITGGVHGRDDLLKSVMAGADVVMIASEFLARGTGRVQSILADTAQWLEEREYTSLAQAQGSLSQLSVDNPSAFERANYMKVLASWRPDPTGSQPF